MCTVCRVHKAHVYSEQCAQSACMQSVVCNECAQSAVCAVCSVHKAHVYSVHDVHVCCVRSVHNAHVCSVQCTVHIALCKVYVCSVQCAQRAVCTVHKVYV